MASDPFPEERAQTSYQNLSLWLLNNKSDVHQRYDILTHCVFLYKHISAIETLKDCMANIPRGGEQSSEEVHALSKRFWDYLNQLLYDRRFLCKAQVERSQALLYSLSSRRVGLPAHHLYREPYPLGAYYYHSRRAP
jgi:hypothetical protein